MGKTAWNDELILRAYKLARSGLRDKTLARSLGVEGRTFARWVKTKPALAAALAEGRDDLGKQGGASSGYFRFKKFAYGNLPRAAQKLWDDVDRVYWMPSGSAREAKRAAMKAVLEGQGRGMRQHLLIHALVTCNFVLSEACRVVNVTPHAVRQWMRKDPAFASLVAGLHESKKDFFESALIDLVARGDSPAIIFTNKTANKDRGYGTGPGVPTSGGFRPAHRLDELDLPPEVLGMILERIRKKSRHQVEDDSNVRGGGIANRKG